MPRADRTPVMLRIVIDRPVAGVLHSLQDKDGGPLDPKCSDAGAPLTFDLPVAVGPGPSFFGDQVRREGPVRRFVYIRVGRLAGDPASPWDRRMKIDIHDIATDLLDEAARGGGVIETRIDGTGRDGTPACATVRPLSRRVVAR